MVRATSLIGAKGFNEFVEGQDKKDCIIAGNLKVEKEDEWLSFELKERKPKTNVYEVVSKCSQCILGWIKWYPSWRHYCFFPTTYIETVHSDRCSLSIGEFVEKLNEEHKKKNENNK